ncbi:hypothetical protein [Haloferula sp. BvORR071]|uniref:hypothetical protein n=1 Tax=Haloferula sp. BvORR071 TaxID=1396141 RepID=UPI0022410152|nr:hypothetical protein [Haloferula sp. BvORR071]
MNSIHASLRKRVIDLRSLFRSVFEVRSSDGSWSIGVPWPRTNAIRVMGKSAVQ